MDKRGGICSLFLIDDNHVGGFTIEIGDQCEFKSPNNQIIILLAIEKERNTCLKSGDLTGIKKIKG